MEEQRDPYLDAECEEIIEGLGFRVEDTVSVEIVDAIKAALDHLRRWHPVDTEKPPVRTYMLISVDGHIPAGILAYMDENGDWYSGVDGQMIKRPDYIRYWRLL